VPVHRLIANIEKIAKKNRAKIMMFYKSAIESIKVEMKIFILGTIANVLRGLKSLRALNTLTFP